MQKTEEGNGEGVCHGELRCSIKKNIDDPTASRPCVSNSTYVEDEPRNLFTEQQTTPTDGLTGHGNVVSSSLDLQRQLPALKDGLCNDEDSDCAVGRRWNDDVDRGITSSPRTGQNSAEKYRVGQQNNASINKADKGANLETFAIRRALGFVSFGITKAIQGAFSFEATPGRKCAFKLIDPRKARRIREEFLYDDHCSDESSNTWSVCPEKPHVHWHNRDRVSTKSKFFSPGKKEYFTFGKSGIRLEEVLMFICALSIIFGYSLSLYYHF